MKVATMAVDEYRSLLGVPKGYRAVSAKLDEQNQFIEVFFESTIDPWQEVLKPGEYRHPFNPRADTFQRDAASHSR